MAKIKKIVYCMHNWGEIRRVGRDYILFWPLYYRYTKTCERCHIVWDIELTEESLKTVIGYLEG